MGATILEVAKACGTSKTSVRRQLDALGLWDEHTTRGKGGAILLDHYAAAAVADSLGKALGGSVGPSGGALGSDPSNGANQTETALVQALNRHIDSLENQLKAKDDVIRDLANRNEQLSADLMDARERAARAEARRGGWFARLLGAGD